MKHGIWLVGLLERQVLHLLIGQWSDKPVNIGTVEVTISDHLPDKRFKDVLFCHLLQIKVILIQIWVYIFYLEL